MSVNCRFVYRFENKGTGETKEAVVTGVRSKYEAYNEARNNMTEDLNTSVRLFESNWMIKDREIAIGISEDIKVPESTIKNKIESLRGVESTDKIDSGSRDEHVVYYIRTESLLNEDYLIDKIRDMFKEIDNEDQDELVNDILVIINPPYYVND